MVSWRDVAGDFGSLRLVRHQEDRTTVGLRKVERDGQRIRIENTDHSWGDWIDVAAVWAAREW